MVGREELTKREAKLRTEARLRVDASTHAACVDLHAVWYRTLSSVAALDPLRDVEDLLRLLARPRVTKALAWSEDELVGVSFVTNDLDTVPGISAEFFRARYPQETDQGSLWYVVRGYALPNRPGILSRLTKVCVSEARRHGAEVILWDTSSLQRTGAMRSTVDAVKEVYGNPGEVNEVDIVSFQAIRVPHVPGEATVIDLRSV